jgi:hypothetical protein
VIALLAAAVLGSMPGSFLPAADPAPEALRLQLASLREERANLHVAVPSLMVGGGVYAAWTGGETLLVAAILGCHAGCEANAVGASLAIGGGAVALSGLVWLLLDLHQRGKLDRQIGALEQRLMDLRSLEGTVSLLRF